LPVTKLTGWPSGASFTPQAQGGFHGA